MMLHREQEHSKVVKSGNNLAQSRLSHPDGESELCQTGKKAV